MNRTIWIQATQLTRRHPALADSALLRDPSTRVLFIESRERSTVYRYHRRKLALLFSAMRHFAAGLAREGAHVEYHALHADGSHLHSGFEDALRLHVSQHAPGEILMMELADHPHAAAIPGLTSRIGVPIRVLPSTMFLTDRSAFAERHRTSRRLVMEHHYREMRRRLRILMDGEEPAGGRWNFDTENRKPYDRAVPVPPLPAVPDDPVARDTAAMVNALFADHPGPADGPALPATRQEALRWLDDFVDRRLPYFGMYQDAMDPEEGVLFHSLLSPALNIGLLHPDEVARAAERAYLEGRVPLPAAEGFIRQVIGWREYMYGVYWLRMPGMAEANALDADMPLPGFFWDGATRMRCLALTIRQAIGTGYLHHIQRLMIICNFATLAGIRPQAVLEWFMTLFIDAYDWVMVPNVMGMGTYADGGSISTKPYVSSGAYINRMSGYCRGCHYSPRVKTGPAACPFNHLYWSFLERNGEKLRGNHRMRMAYNMLEKKGRRERTDIRRSAESFLASPDG